MATSGENSLTHNAAATGDIIASRVTRIPELDGLRGIAILLVIGCHYEVFARQFWGLPKYGWVGVDLFFVLSGFLITTVLLNLRGREDAFRTFYARRIRRIIPPYVAFLVLLYLACAAFGDYALYKKGTIVRNLLFMQSFGGIGGIFRLMASGETLSLAHIHLGPARSVMQGNVSEAWDVLWSLSIEEYYYLLWAPVVLWMARKRAVTTGIVICIVTLAMRWLGSLGSAAYYSIYHRFDAPVFGSLVAFLLASSMARRTVNAILIASGAGGLTVLALVLVPMGNVLGREIRQDHAFMVFGVPSLSLVAAMMVGLAAKNSGARFLFVLRSRGLRFFGKISYTLYLLHAFVYLCILHFFSTWPVTLAALFCAVTASWLSWTYYEEPILQGGRENSKKARNNLNLVSAA